MDSKKDRKRKWEQQNDAPGSSLRYSTYYHDYFQGYTEAKVPKKNGKGSTILRVYTAPYHKQAVEDGLWRFNRIRCLLLFAGAALLYGFAMTRPLESNSVWYVALPGLLSVIPLLLLLAALLFYVTRRRLLTLYDYNTGRKRLLQASLISCIALWVTAAASLIFACVFAPLLAPYSPTAMDYSAMLAKPSKAHPLGCDDLGRDMLSRLLYGGRASLSLGFISALVGAAIGIFLGALIGYAGGKTDMIVMRVMDIWASIPQMLLAILISTSLGAGFVNTIIAMTVGSIPGSVRGQRAMCLKEREMEYLEAAQSINCSKMKIIFRHMLPNTIAPAIVGTTMSIGGVIMGAAGLAYIGLGIRPPSPEWGAMLAAGRTYILTYPHLIMFPGIAIAITVLSINLFGDGLRDALDPRLKQ